MAELAGILAQLNRRSEATKWLDLANKKAGSDCRYALALAKAFAAAGRYSESDDAFEQVESCRLVSADVLVDMASMEELRGDASKAEATYRRAVKLEPRSPTMLSALASFYAGSGRHTLTGELYEKAAQLQGDDYDYWDSAGDERMAAAEMSAAKRDYSRALSVYDSDDGALVGLGNIAIAHQDWATADRSCSMAARHTPVNAAVWSCLGEIYAARSEWDHARSAAERAVWESRIRPNTTVNLPQLRLAGDPLAAAFHTNASVELSGGPH